MTPLVGHASPKHPEDGLDAFAAEAAPLARAVDWSRRHSRPLMVAAAIAAIGIAIGAAAGVAYVRWFAGGTRSASLTIETTPSGLEVSIDGTSRGRTPLTMTLPPRAYEVIVGSGSEQRSIKTSLAAGVATVERLDFTARQAAIDQTRGILRIDTNPTALAITIDGTERGVSPLTLEHVTAGEHDVAVASGRESLHRKVTVRGGETLSLLVTAGAVQSSVAAGWISVEAPVTLQIREAGKLLGTTEADRLLIPAGNHSLDFVNADLSFSQRLAVTVAPGKGSLVRVKVPNGTISLNAQPWAEVWVDGARVGETPIGNLVRPIGRHEVVFRHPELGERRETVVVTALQPARLGVDLRRKTP